MEVKNSKEDVDILKLYGESATLTKEDFIKKHNVNINGLSSAESENRIHNLRL